VLVQSLVGVKSILFCPLDMASMMGDDGMMASALILMNGEIFMVVRDEKYSCWLPTHEVVN
jgi:hypothetical protein